MHDRDHVSLIVKDQVELDMPGTGSSQKSIINRRKLQFETGSLTVDLQCRCQLFCFDRFEESTRLAAVSRRHDPATSR